MMYGVGLRPEIWREFVTRYHVQCTVQNIKVHLFKLQWTVQKRLTVVVIDRHL